MHIVNLDELKHDLKQKRTELATLEQEKTNLLANEMNPFLETDLRDVDENIQLCKEEMRAITDLF